MTPELCHWIVIGIKGLLIYFIGLPVFIVFMAALVALLVAILD